MRNDIVAELIAAGAAGLAAVTAREMRAIRGCHAAITPSTGLWASSTPRCEDRPRMLVAFAAEKSFRSYTACLQVVKPGRPVSLQRRRR